MASAVGWLILLLFLRKTAANYQNCVRSPAADHVIMPRKQCIQNMKTYSAWFDTHWDTCEAEGGTLVGVFSSTEAAALHAWLSGVGAIRNDALYLAFTRTAVGMDTSYWLKGRNKVISANTTFSDHYDVLSINYNSYTGIASNTIGVLKKSTLQYSFNQDGLTDHQIMCQFPYPRPTPTVWKRQGKNKKSEAKAYERAAEKDKLFCGTVCSDQPYCLGFNVVNEVEGVICEYLSVTLADKGLSLVSEDGTDYYEIEF